MLISESVFEAIIPSIVQKPRADFMEMAFLHGPCFVWEFMSAKISPSSHSVQKGLLTQILGFRTQELQLLSLCFTSVLQNSTFAPRVLHRGWGEQGREGEGLSQDGESSAEKWIAELSAWQTSMKQ